MAMNVKNTTTSSGLDSSLKIQTTDPQEVDRAGTEEEAKEVNGNWTKYLGYYKSHLAVKAVINKLALWIMGEGIEADKETTKILDKIVGWGKEPANEVFDNQIRVEHINGDSYAEIITTDGEEIAENGSNLLNLKPLNPGSMKHIINPQGLITGYKQVNSDGSEIPYRLNQIFHLSLNRTADEIHGTGDIESLTTFLDKIKQVDEDMAVMFHRFVVPLVIWKLNTDDPTAMATFKAQEKSAWNTGDNLIIPDTAVNFELLEAGKGVGKIINPMDWRNKWTEEVIKGGGVPALIMAIEAGTTEASSKMVTLAWEKVVKKGQLDLEKQIKLQLGLKINLPQSITIEESLIEDKTKDGQIDKPVNINPAKHE